MSLQHKREHGSAYHSYAQPYEHPQRDPLVVFVRFELLPSTEEHLVQLHGDATLRTQTDGDAAEPHVSEQVAQVEKFRRLMEQNFPILNSLEYEITISGACLWRKFYDPNQNAALYRSWRQWAWTLWECTAEVIAHTDLQIEDISVQPLPGPCRYAFL